MFNAKLNWLAATFALLFPEVSYLYADGDNTISNVLVTGYPAPGIPGDIDFLEQFGTMDINNSGEVTFSARLTGSGVNPSNDQAIFSGEPLALGLVARLGGHAPSFPESIFLLDLDLSPFIGDQGTVTYRVLLDGPGVGLENNLAYYSNSSPETEPVFLSGSPAPGTLVGVILSDVFIRAASDDGEAALVAVLDGIGVDKSNSQAIYANLDGGPLQLVVRQGDSLPGGVGSFENLLFDVVINNANQVAFEADTSLGRGVFRYDDGVLEAVASPGQSPPGTPLGTTFDSFVQFGVSINGAGNVAFASEMIELSGESLFGIFSDVGGELLPIALSGEDAPGVPLSGNFRDFGGTVLNNAGDIAFVASLIGLGINESNDRAIFARINGHLRLIAREGVPAAGTVNGVDYSDFNGISMNSSGQIVFNASLKGNVTEDNDSAIFVASNGYPELLIREGFLFDVDDDPGSIEFRFIESYRQGNPFVTNNSGGQDGRRSGINDAGQVLFALSFTDSTNGIFVADCRFVLGDINGDGVVDLLDVGPFIDLINSGELVPEADVNGDGEINLLDVAPFIALLTD